MAYYKVSYFLTDFDAKKKEQMIADTMKLLVVLLVAGIALAENPEGTSFSFK